MGLKSSQIQKNLALDKTLYEKIADIASNNEISTSKVIEIMILDFIDKYGVDVIFDLSYKIKKGE